MMKKKMAVGLAFAALSVSSPVALATDVFQLEGIGAVSRAMGGTAVAHDVGPGGMLTNPANLSFSPNSREVMVGFDLVTTDITVKNKATGESVDSDTHSRNRGPYFAPELAYTHRLGSLTLGIGAFAQGGLGTEYGRSGFLSRSTGGADTGLENSSRLLVLDIPLAASYKVNDALTIGGSIDALWQGLNLDLLLGADQVGSLIGSGRVTGSLLPALGGIPGLQGAHFSLTKNRMLGSGVDAWGYAGRLGLAWQVTSDTRLGAAYNLRSRVSDMEGDATLTAISGVLGHIPLEGRIKIRDFQMPAKLVIGGSHRVTPQWMLTADVSRVFWKEVMKDIKVTFEADAGGNLNIRLPQDYRDQTIVALGTSYALTAEWTLRAGARYATQALRKETLFAVIPATPTKHLSVGFSYAVSPTDHIDFAFSHALREKMDNNSLPNTSVPIEVKHTQNNATLSYTLSF